MKIQAGQKIRIEFDLKLKSGELIEHSTVEYVQGEGKLLPALEKRLLGMSLGEEKSGVIPAEEAITEESLPTKEVPRSEFPKDAKLQVGQVFEARGPEGSTVSFKLVKVTDDKVTIRFLHSLLGKDLAFHVKVLMIDDPKSKRRAVAVPPPPAAALGIDELKEG
jgi:FKBP-type peptidyl-prolyl cis-trans isomerase 2